MIAMTSRDLLTPTELEASLAELPDWAVDGDELVKTYVTKNFAQAALFFNAIGLFAEAMDHHPDVLVHGYKRVTVRLTTHDRGGITAFDTQLAAQIDALPRK